MKKGVALLIVLGTLIIIITLAFAALALMTQESRVAEHKIKRYRAFGAVQAGYVNAFNRIVNGVSPLNSLPTVGSPRIYSITIGNNTIGYPSGGMTVEITALARGDNYTDSHGETFNCTSVPYVPSGNFADYCIFSKVASY